MDKVTLGEWIKNYLEGKYSAPDVETQCKAGWYDWFCKKEILHKKTQKLAKKLIKVIWSNGLNPQKSKFNPETCYVFFKNNCPCDGTLYDDFRICDIKTGKVIYNICPKDGHTSSNGAAQLWGKDNDFKEPIVKGTFKDILKYFEN